MCGVVAIVRPSGLREDEREATLVRMRDALTHRGPDDATVEVIDDWVGLGFRRLSIIDLEGSRQPLHNETGTISCLFNGEIYNFQELRERLTALGHRFATHGDGEVIVHGYEQWGDTIASMLEGMFAFILVDRQRPRIIAARDRFGIKPLYWTRAGGALLFASEIKGLLPHPAVRRVANRLALGLGAVRMHVPWPLTAFDGIYQLPPGVLVEIARGGELSFHRHAPIVSAAPVTTEAGGSLVERALAELERAVARQMVADVPVGAFLSGGIDSTLVVALMRRITSDPVHTFSIRTRRHDESKVAVESARRLGTVHHELDLEDLPFERLLLLPELYDEPFAEVSALGVRVLSHAAREHVKVALSGDGGDEIFGGYDEYRWIRHTRATARLPRWLTANLHAGSLALLGRRRWPTVVRQGLRAIALIGADHMSAQRGLSSLAWAAVPRNARESEQLSARVDGVAAHRLQALGPARRAMATDRLERLPDAMLRKVDIASMSASLEVRVPMLDDALVRFADTVREQELVGLRRGKLLLRRVLERLLPHGPAWDRKRGFSLPLDLWMRCTPMRNGMAAMFHDQQAQLLRLTGVDVTAKWRQFEAGSSKASPTTTAAELLWFVTVAQWAKRFDVTEVAESEVEALQIV